MNTSSSARRSSQPRAAYQRPRQKGLGERIFRLILLILVVGVLSALTTLYFVWPDFSLAKLNPNSQQSQPANNDAESNSKPLRTPLISNAKPNFVDFEPFTVTLDQEGRSRILYVGITLQVADNHSRELLQQYQPVVRDRILHVLSLQDPQQVQTPTGRETLIQQLDESLSLPYPPANQAPEINHVLFTTFVVQ
ncbi:MAG TPA: flagellar basal body-associated FliL family protein [Paenalcaligenes sp.]|nr:flagellar basal body-associated FliL family protein [Paenalcaligenes sp.]